MNFSLTKLIQNAGKFMYPKISSTMLYSTSAPATSVSPAPVSIPTVAAPDKLYSTIELEMRGHDPAVLKSYAWYLAQAAQLLNIPVGKNYALRKADKDRYTLLKSVHIYKKHRVQYEIRTYFRFLHLHRLTGSTADTYLEYIERNLPEGVSLKVTKVEIQPLPEHLEIVEKTV
ncbi:28S ribosomal protein S10, mitochondrial [Chrysoperla carnea]|uniref:28S ribosomal protein S10, mitochondrial n=1 Tax=Chrysoperla carnea TaxID=189513 RepID=UPI001D0983D5|nr:28S ribosomal protein S10, mitochondrial [Chrysoperla carnea]